MQVGDRVRVERGDVSVTGTVLPSTTDKHLVVKQPSGYNVGVDRADASVEILEQGAIEIDEANTSPGSTGRVEVDPELPTISLLSTGGTIASTVDYRTGAVSPQFDVDDVLRIIPELEGLANYRGRVVSNILSENMSPAVWQELARAIGEEIEAGADGIVVMHGTDTMQYTASMMAFMIETPVPIVFTGSQRSADRPSSDNVMNAVCAVTAAKSDIAEVLVCMHASNSDDLCSLHRGTRVRKNHTSMRPAFETVGGRSLATVDYEDRSIELRDGATPRERGAVDLAISTELNTNVELLKFTPDAPADRLSACSGQDGIVIEGTGLGHVNEEWREAVATLARDTAIVMTSQCLDGRICDRVYETGRDLLEAGVIEAEDTLPETALVKLMWVLANEESVPESMQISLAGECTAQSRPWS